MSRRLEVIPTGYIDYGAAAQKFMTGFQQGRAMLMQEEERQRRLQELENQRASIANTIFRQHQADVERFGTDLSTSEKQAFTAQFDGIMEANRGVQDFLLKGGKVNSSEYIALQDGIEKQKKDLQMRIGALKEIKDGMSQIVTLEKSKYEGFGGDKTTLMDMYNRVLKGSYIPSIDIPSKTSITQKAFVAPGVIYESYIPKISVNQQDHVVKDSNKKIIRTEKKQIPVYSDLETVAYDAVNAPSVNSSGVMRDFNNFKTLNKDGLTKDYQTRYDLYKMYMKDSNKPEKEIKDFQPVDYVMMEMIARKYKPAPDEAERFYKESSGRGGGGSVSAKQAEEMSQMISDYFSGDEEKRNSVVNKISGALNTKGWDMSFKNNYFDAVKGADEWNKKGLTYQIGTSYNDTNKSKLMAVIKAYFSAIGSAGVMQR
jgi:hypothetical protein